jgi:hypothetical protein
MGSLVVGCGSGVKYGGGGGGGAGSWDDAGGGDEGGVGKGFSVMITGLNVFVKVWTIVFVEGIVVVSSSEVGSCDGAGGRLVTITGGRVNVCSGIVVVGMVSSVLVSTCPGFFSGEGGWEGVMIVVEGTKDEERIGSVDEVVMATGG